jgi:NitT/TauT family transport system permease protein
LAAKAFLVVLIVCFPTAITLARGLRSVDEETLLFAQMLCAPNWRIIWKIHLPAAIPSLFDSFRLSIPLAMVGAVIGEFISSDGGLGNILLVAISTLNMPLAFASLLAMSIATMLCYLPLLPFERYLLRWQPLWQR